MHSFFQPSTIKNGCKHTDVSEVERMSQVGGSVTRDQPKGSEPSKTLDVKPPMLSQSTLFSLLPRDAIHSRTDVSDQGHRIIEHPPTTLTGSKTDLSLFVGTTDDGRKRRRLGPGAEDIASSYEPGDTLTSKTENSNSTRKSPRNASTFTARGLLDDRGSNSRSTKKAVWSSKTSRASSIEVPNIQTTKNKLSHTKIETRNKNLVGKPTSPSETTNRKSIRLSTNGKLVEDDRCLAPKSPQKNANRHVMPASKSQSLKLKNGKFSPSLVVRLRYSTDRQSDRNLHKKVEQILSTTPSPCEQTKSAGHSVPDTHPFFLGKGAIGSDARGRIKGANGTGEPVAWADLGFKNNRIHQSRSETVLEKAPWPLRAYQHIGVEKPLSAAFAQVSSRDRGKSKALNIQEMVTEDEDVVQRYMRALSGQQPTFARSNMVERLVTTAESVLRETELNHHGNMHAAVSSARQHALHGSSSFDRSEAKGPLSWPQQYAPERWQDVMQPLCVELYDWLKGLAVHNIKSGLTQPQSKQSRRGRKPRKLETDLNDFIVEDDTDLDATKLKNTILIVGPPGCGKSAAVYAVAKELDIEVFEINSGMKRGQKEIFDKVGDMAQNHLVQGGNRVHSREGSAVLEEHEVGCNQPDIHQPSVASMFELKKTKKLAPSHNLLGAKTPQQKSTNKQQQKQSLILFEEVDQVFEDDKGFWSGVQSLIENTKRPVVLTCNSLDKVPTHELNLHATLNFVPQPAKTVTDYLAYVAAAEGHVIEKSAVETLYAAKNFDLRATMTELDFWCQMTVGSQKGGLDWYLTPEQARIKPRVRVFSKDTYTDALELSSLEGATVDRILEQIHHELDISPHSVFANQIHHTLSSQSHSPCPLSNGEIFDMMTMFSDLDVVDPLVSDAIYLSMHRQVGADPFELNRHNIAKLKFETLALYDDRPTISRQFQSLRALEIEEPIFPPAQGRLAPSLDSPTVNPPASVTCDIAPYVRGIASFDLRLEDQREELFSSQGKKARNTRAARAAAEGGSKADSRRDRWFSKELDLVEVLKTGGNWPDRHHEPATVYEKAGEVPRASQETQPVFDIMQSAPHDTWEAVPKVNVS